MNFSLIEHMSIYTIWRFNKHTHRFYTMDLQLDNIVGDIQATKDVVEIFAGGDEVDSGAAATSWRLFFCPCV